MNAEDGSSGLGEFMLLTDLRGLRFRGKQS